MVPTCQPCDGTDVTVLYSLGPSAINLRNLRPEQAAYLAAHALRNEDLGC